MHKIKEPGDSDNLFQDADHGDGLFRGWAVEKTKWTVIKSPGVREAPEIKNLKGQIRGQERDGKGMSH